MQVAAATAGLEAFGQDYVPSLEAHPAVIAFLQGGTLMASSLLSLVLARKLAAQPWTRMWPHCAGIMLMTAELWQLVV